MVPLNHCTETRRRSMTAASVPSTESGGSWPRSMIPTSRPYPPPRDVRWLKPPSPRIPLTFDNLLAQTPVPHAPPGKGRLRSMARRTHVIRESGAIHGRPESRRSGCAELSMFLGRREGRNLPPFPVKPPVSPLWHSSDSILNLLSERRRIVALVRRKAPK